jgi:hypothetical protein
MSDIAVPWNGSYLTLYSDEAKLRFRGLREMIGRNPL